MKNNGLEAANPDFKLKLETNLFLKFDLNVSYGQHNVALRT